MNRPVRRWMNQQVITRTSPEARTMVVVGRSNHWHFQAMGKAEIPTRPLFLRNWVLVPIDQDSSLIPASALQRVQAIYSAGLRPKGFVLAHEAPRELKAPPGSDTPKSGPRVDWRKLREESTEKLKRAADHLPDMSVVGPVLIQGLKVLGIAMAGLAAVPILLAGAVGAAVLVDPVLFAVTSDGYWVEIDRWYA